MALSRVAMRIKCNDKGKAQTYPGSTINMPTSPSSNQAFFFRHGLSEMTALRLISTCRSDFGHSV